MKALREYVRIRENHIAQKAMHINQMQKALIQMNIRLPEVLNQIHGASGIAMITAILSGERDAGNLVSLCHSSIRKTKSEQVIKALEGHYTSHGIFALQQAYAGYQFYQQQIEHCDTKIQEALEQMAVENHDAPVEKVKKRKPIRHHKPKVEGLAFHLLTRFEQKDATVLPGITDYTWLQLFAELGQDLSKWSTEKHFTSWLGLAPGQHHSGKRKRNRNKKAHPKAGQIFRTMAQSLLASKHIGLGAFGRRIRAKKGPRVAIKAVARKLAILYWRLMVKGLKYTERGIDSYQEKINMQKEKWLKKTAKELGYQIIIDTN